MNLVLLNEKVIQIMKNYFILVLTFCLFVFGDSFAQQDPQYTQYMYNTQVVNPAYTGSKEVLSLGLLGRTQWVGFDGAPKTGTFTLSSPVGPSKNMGLGFSVVHDQYGPSTESNITIDYSYTIQATDNAKLAFGLKGGMDILDVDFTKLNASNGGDIFEQNIDKKIQPQIGAGVFYSTNKFYAGLSIPNFLETSHFNRTSIDGIVDNASSTAGSTTAAERMHYFFITGYVFEINENLKFKPASFVKIVKGAPLQWDLSANFLINEKITLGASYRWSAAISALAGFQVSESIFLGFGYDYQTTDIERFSNGSYEVFLSFDIFNNPEKILTPRFF
jgi:type IX secretion system PorP/SprF family membrane protein